MLEQSVVTGRSKEDPITKSSQDFLYFPNAIPDIAAKLVDDLRQENQQRLPYTPEIVESEVKRGLMRACLGSVTTVVYAALAERIVPHIKQNQPLLIEQFPRTPFYMIDELPKYTGYADDFARTGAAWLLGSAARVFAQAENPQNRHHLLVKTLIHSIRGWNAYVAADPQKRTPLKDKFPKDRAWLKCAAARADVRFGHYNLLENIMISLELLLQFGLSYSRVEQAFPDGQELTAAALAYVPMMARAGSIGRVAFSSMVHNSRLGPTFHQYELTHLDTPEDLYPGHEGIFYYKDGLFTFRYPPIQKEPKKDMRGCTAARAYRPPEARGQDAIEEFYACAEKHGGRSIPRPGDGTFTATSGLLIFGSFISKETIYAAWPRQAVT